MSAPDLPADEAAATGEDHPTTERYTTIKGSS